MAGKRESIVAEEEEEQKTIFRCPFRGSSSTHAGRGPTAIGDTIEHLSCTDVVLQTRQKQWQPQLHELGQRCFA